MPNPPILQPTLWRTCRVLANQTRLKILALLARSQWLTVSAVAENLDLTLAVASQSLRALESRGLLSVRRDGRRVLYGFNRTSESAANPLAAQLRTALHRGSVSAAMIFRLATAFTHPRRVEIVRLLQTEPRTVLQMQVATGISYPAMIRHLHKLESRGFVAQRDGNFVAVEPLESLGRVLGRMAWGG
ncbi:MAG: metalloregulator ArsR/SmtB family transcription factor [Pedosphaera sp.]|nr:metalloregulator ArsR/SmtB family transcription factor [Pedosphaera sp.]